MFDLEAIFNVPCESSHFLYVANVKFREFEFKNILPQNQVPMNTDTIKKPFSHFSLKQYQYHVFVEDSQC